MEKNEPWEVAWGDAVNSDANILKLISHHLGEVNGGSFGGVVREVSLGVGDHARHRGDGNDGWVEVAALLLGLLEKWKECNGLD